MTEVIDILLIVVHQNTLDPKVIVSMTLIAFELEHFPLYNPIKKVVNFLCPNIYRHRQISSTGNSIFLLQTQTDTHIDGRTDATKCIISLLR